MRLTGSLLRRLSPLLRRQAFRLQSQMDIHPRSLWHNPDFALKTEASIRPGTGPGARSNRPRPRIPSAATCWSF